jgi:Trk-type K+ transport system membrane component
MTGIVWSVLILLWIGLIGTAFVIYYILNMAYEEMQDVSVQDKKDQPNH